MNLMKILTTFIYRTMVIQEFTSSPSKIIHFGSQFLNELLILKCGFLIYSDKQGERNQFEDFIVYIIRPYSYFIRKDLQDIYTLICFLFIQVIIIYWCYLTHYREQKNENSYINIIKKYEAHSILNFILISFWKMLFIFITEFLGLIMLEGCFEILLDDNQDNLFCIICSIIIIIEIMIIKIFQELFFNQSLQFIPKEFNKYIQQTQLVLHIKFLKVLTLALFASTIINRAYFVLGISILIAMFDLYLELIVRIRLEITIIKMKILMLCLILCVSFQQLFTTICNIKLQFLWLIVTILLYKVFYIIFLSDSISQFQSNQKNQHQLRQYLIKGKQKIYTYQNLSKTRNTIYHLTNKILISKHLQECFNYQCYCRNEDMININLNQMLLQELIQEYKQIIDQQKKKLSFIFQEYIQLLILNNQYFDALNLTQKLFNQFNTTSNFSKSTQLIKDQISLQQKLQFKLLQQEIMIAIQYSIQNRTQNSLKIQGLKMAIKSYQQKKESEKSIKYQFNIILKQKIEFLNELLNLQTLNPQRITDQALKIINNIDQFKEQLILHFKKMPSNSQIILFYQLIEILNDLISSQTIYSISASQEKIEELIVISTMYQQLVNQFSNAKFSFGEDGSIEIASNNAENQLNFGKNKYNSFNEMIPQSLISHHKYFIEEFIKTGKNKYYLDICQSFLQTQAGIIVPIEICIDIHFDEKMNQLMAIALFKEANNLNQLHFLIIDNKFKIKEVSKILYYEILDYPTYLKMQFYNQLIFSIVPELKEEDLLQDRIPRSFRLCFPSIINRLNSGSFKSQNKYNYYYGDISINRRFINGKILYYIIEISDLKSEREEIIKSIHQYQGDMDEKEIIDIPLEISPFNDQLILQQMWMQPIYSNLETERQLLQFSETGQEFQKRNNNGKINLAINQVQARSLTVSDRNLKSEKFDDAHSQISSVAAFRRSAYFKQFQLINDLINSKIFPPNITLFNAIYIIYIIIGIISFGLLINQVTKLQNYQELMVLLKIKYDIIEPISSFQNTRYTITGLNSALLIKQITQIEYDQLILFPRSNLAKGYDDLKINIMDVIQKSEFQSFLKDKYFEAYWYTSTNNGSLRNTTFRSGILAMLNYQYEYKLAYTIKPLVIDSAYFYYSYKNYISFFNIFTDFNEDILDLLFTLISDQQNQIELLNIIFNILLAISCIGSILF